ncbi:MAG: hypothetical protein WCI26_13320 [Acidimicrobiales bacterium]|jgi:hypothetical protein
MATSPAARGDDLVHMAEAEDRLLDAIDAHLTMMWADLPSRLPAGARP